MPPPTVTDPSLAHDGSQPADTRSDGSGDGRERSRSHGSDQGGVHPPRIPPPFLSKMSLIGAGRGSQRGGAGRGPRAWGVLLGPLALVAFLSQLPVAFAAESDQCRRSELNADRPWWDFGVVGFILGVVVGWLVSRLAQLLVAAAPPQQLGGYSGLGSTPRADVLQGVPPLQPMPRYAPRTRSVEKMSPVTYKWKLQQPRFQPLGQYQHGGWASNSDS